MITKAGTPGEITSLIDFRARATPELVALVDEAGVVVTFAEFRQRVVALAVLLSKCGISRGTRVSWQLPTSIGAVILVGALARLDAVQNPILSIYRERELSFIVRQSEPD